MNYLIMKSALLALALLLAAPQQAQAQRASDDAEETVDRQRQVERDSDARQARTPNRERGSQTATRQRGAEAQRRGTDRDQRAGAQQPQQRQGARAQQRRSPQTAQRSGGQATQRPGAQRPGGQAGQQRGGQAGGPMFCRTGEGHPVFGMQWCHDKGFQTPTWRPGSLGDIIIGRDTRRQGTIGGGVLEDILGRDASRMVRDRAARDGFVGDLVGTWIDRNTLELALGGAPIARLLDRTGDGRVDQTLLAEY